MNFSNLSDVSLEKETLNTVAYLKRGETKLLHLLAEIEKRRLYSKQHPSLFEYCVKTLKLSCGSAQRRIDAMRAMKLIPEIEAKILSGDLNLASISQAQTFFRQEKKAGKVYSLCEKKEVLARLENKNTRECTLELVAISPLAIPPETSKPLNSELTQLRIVADLELMALLEQVRTLNSHKNLTQAELLKVVVKDYLTRKDPAQKIVRKQKSTAKRGCLKSFLVI